MDGWMNRWMVNHEVLLRMCTMIYREYWNKVEASCSDEYPGLDQVSQEVVSVWEKFREDHEVPRVRPREERSTDVVACVTCH